MPIIPLLPIFHSLNRKYFDGLLVINSKPIVSVRWSDGRLRNTAGFYRHGKTANGKKICEIVLSSPILENLPISAVESTLCHEMIHAWIDLVLKVSEGHGKNFHARMKFINSAQSKFQVNIRHHFPVPVKIPKWLGVCPICGLKVPYKRRVKGVACKKCCDALYGGRWHSSCVLNFESLVKVNDP